MGIDPATYDLIFYSAPFSRANRHFPIGSLDKWTVHTVTTVKTFEDVVATVTVPWFDGWDVVNLIKNTKTGYVYWVTASSVSTLSSRSVAFELLYNAPTSTLKAGDSLTGVWDRLPTNECPYLKETVGDDALKVSRKVSIPKLPVLANRQICWYEIVVRQELSMASPPPTDERFIRYGGFAYIPLDDSNSNEDFLVSAGSDAGAQRWYAYPSLHKIMDDFTAIAANATTDVIISINASMRCPFKWKTDQNPNYTPVMIYLVDGSNNFIIPHTFATWGVTHNSWALYALEDLTSVPVRWSEDMTLILTDQERRFGEISVMTEVDNVIAVIPTEYAASLPITVTCTTDYTGIYTDLIFAGTRIRLPETKLPWTGSAWADYQVRSMDTDRASMNLSIETAKQQRTNDAIMSVANVGMSAAIGFAMGGPVGAVALTAVSATSGIVGAEMQGRISEHTARSEQEINEAHQKMQLSNNFNTSYGLVQLLDNLRGSTSVAVSLPANISPAYITSWHSEFGYRVQGVRTHTLQTGRYKGRLTELPIQGVKGDLLNAEFIEGIKIEVIT